MTKLLQRWEFSAQFEQSLDQEIALCAQYGFDGIIAKALDGDMWMGVVDNNPDALRSIDQVAEQAQRCHDHGLRYYTWVNPLVAALRATVQPVIDMTQVCDGVGFDTEPYDHFLGAWPPVGVCEQYMAAIRANKRDAALLIWQPDPRAQHLQEIRQDEWGAYMDIYAPQVYVSDFYLQPTATLMRALLAEMRDVAQQYGLIAWPTLPGNVADPGLFAADSLAQDQGLVVWRIGSTPADNLSFLGGINVAQQDVDPCADTAAQLESQRLFVRDIADRIVQDRLTGVLNLRKPNGRKVTIPAQVRSEIQSVIDEAQSERTQSQGPRGVQLVERSSGAPALRRGATGSIAEGANPH